MTIKQEFDKLITDVFPQKGCNGSGPRCSLTFRRRKEFEDIFFASYRMCFVRFMLSSDKTEEEAKREMDDLCSELDFHFSKKP
jgi:hypothetical protein